MAGMEADGMSKAHATDGESPRFSVIIPAYNSAATLGRAVESVLSQTWAAHEIIVVDDGSSDDSLQIARSYGGSVQVIHQENAGVSVARNRGVEIATGNWLAFLDADDWYYPDRLRLHAEWIGRDPGLDFLTGDYEYRDEDGTLTGTSMAAHASGQALLVRCTGTGEAVLEDREFESFVADHFGDTHTLSVPREAFLRLGGYPPGFRVCEDVHFLVRLCAVSHRVGVVCRPLGAYLVHGYSATRADTLQAQLDNVQTLMDLKRLAADFPDPVRRGVMARLRNGRLNLAYALVRSGRRREAVGSVLPSLFETPGWASLRNLASMLKG